MRARPVAARASRMAAIVASVPELTSRTISIDGTSRTIASAMSTSSDVGAPKASPDTSCRAIGAHGRVDAAGQHLLGALEQRAAHGVHGGFAGGDGHGHRARPAAAQPP